MMKDQILTEVINQSLIPLSVAMLENCITELKTIQHTKINIYNIFNQSLCYLDAVKGIINVLHDLHYEYSE